MKDLICRLRLLELDHVPDGWPAIRMRDVSALLDQVQLMRGQRGVLCGLLRECVKVIDTIEADDVDEFDNLCDLTDKVQAAITGVEK